MNILCKIFGHKISKIEWIIADIKSNSLNYGKGKNVLECKRCGWRIDLNDPEDIKLKWGNK